MLNPHIIETSIKKISKIYHISDIHFRNFKRHEEYRRVMNTLADYIKNTKNDESIICITGDIVHSKTDITPELVQEVQNFIKLMASLLPTLIIPGNHDANLNNNQRLDSLSPIINAVSEKNIIYIKDTGVYKFANIDFIHWSVFDDPKNYIKASDIDSDFKICMYHGPVNSSLTDAGFLLEDNSISVSDFKGYDIVLLGDIHKRQFLNEAKTIAYPGSLIMQNHAESLVHGILVWDIDSKTSEFVEIKNDTCFYTINVENGLYEDAPTTIPNNVYIRLRTKNTSQSRIKEIGAELRKDRNVIELSLQSINDFSSSSIKQQSNIINVRDIEYQNSILSEYLNTKFNLSEEEIIKICALNRQFNENLPKSETTRNLQWTIKKFEFSNMFSYGKDNIIDFTNMTGVYGIFAANANGKSSVIEALTYCLFDKCSKTSKASLVMNNKSKDFHCKIEFEFNNKTYIIEKNAKRQKSDHVKLDVNFYHIDENGVEISLNGKERADTNSIIRSYIGTYEDFVLTSMSMQNNNTGFIDMSQTERKDLLSQFLDIKIFEDLSFVANEKQKEHSILIKEYKKIDHFEKLKDIELNISAYSNEYRNLQIKKDEIETNHESINSEYISLNSKLINIENNYIDIKEYENNKIKIEGDIKKIEEKLEKSEKIIQDIDDEILKIESSILEIDIDSLNQKSIQIQDYIKIEKDLSIQVEKLKTEMSHKLEKMKKLKDLKYDKNCQFCMENVFVKDAIATEASIERHKENATEVINKLKKIREDIAELKIYEKSIDLYNTLEKSLSDKKINKLKAQTDHHRLSLELNQSNKDLGEYENMILKYREQEAAIESNKEISAQLKELKNKINIIKNELNIINNEIAQCNTDLQLAQKEKIITEQSIEKLKTLENEFKYYNYYLMAVSRDGLPYNLISSVIPKIQDDINNILSQIVDFHIMIQSDGKNINTYIVYEDSKIWPIELSSGMEKFISSLAIRSSLINITSLPRPNFLAIDEGFGALDHSNMNNISILLNYLKTQFKFIIMISHIDTIRDVVDSHIEIVKNKEGVSSVRFQ